MNQSSEGRAGLCSAAPTTKTVAALGYEDARVAAAGLTAASRFPLPPWQRAVPTALSGAADRSVQQRGGDRGMYFFHFVAERYSNQVTLFVAFGLPLQLSGDTVYNLLVPLDLKRGIASLVLFFQRS